MRTHSRFLFKASKDLLSLLLQLVAELLLRPLLLFLQESQLSQLLAPERIHIKTAVEPLLYFYLQFIRELVTL